MKAYFLKMLRYDRFVNEFLFKLVIKTGGPKRPVDIMAHMLAVEAIWFDRCNGIKTDQEIFWPDLQTDDISTAIIRCHSKWTDYLNGLEPGDFEKMIVYTNSKGERFENSLTDILTQVINHGTHHRAQIGQHLKLAGVDPLPNTDYINFIRFVDKV